MFLDNICCLFLASACFVREKKVEDEAETSKLKNVIVFLNDGQTRRLF